MEKTYINSAKEIIQYVILHYTREYDNNNNEVGDFDHEFGCEVRYNYEGVNYEIPEKDTLVKVHFTNNPNLSLCWFDCLDADGNFIVESIFDRKPIILDKNMYAISAFKGIEKGMFIYWDFDDSNEYWKNKKYDE